MLAKVLIAGIRHLFSRREYINRINVFPVPDGDTGTNMLLTLKAAWALDTVGTFGALVDISAIKVVAPKPVLRVELVLEDHYHGDTALCAFGPGREHLLVYRDAIGGGDPDMNPRLRLALDNARSQNMPKDNIERAIKKGTGELEGVSYEESIYEGYGPGGAAVLIESLSDNKNRTVADIRYIFSKAGGNMGENGCVAWMFDKKGYFNVDKAAVGEDKLMEIALDAGAEDFIRKPLKAEVLVRRVKNAVRRSGGVAA